MRTVMLGFLLLCFISPAIFAVNDANLPQYPIGEPGKEAGDIISPSTRIQIAAWCDFTKQIIFINGVFLCAYNGRNKVE